MRPLVLLAAGLLAGAVVAAPVPKAVKKTTQPLEGTWEVVEWYSGDTRLQLTDVIRWTVDGETLTVEGRRPAVPAGFLANATRSVKRPAGGEANAIDYTISPTDGTESSFRPAVFELDGGTFKICLSSTRNGPRPAECKPVEGTTMYVLKRVTDEKKDK